MRLVGSESYPPYKDTQVPGFSLGEWAFIGTAKHQSTPGGPNDWQTVLPPALLLLYCNQAWNTD